MGQEQKAVKIFVIEDSTDFRELLREVLELKGYLVDEATNGKEALDKLEQMSDLPNLVLLDHLIPLCAGGSNQVDNLWPQHQSVYDITDPLEGIACEKMAAGRLRQARAIELLLRAKHHLEEAPAILKHLESL